MVALPHLIPGVFGMAGRAALAFAVVAKIEDQADVQRGDKLVVLIGKPRQIGRAEHLARGDALAVSRDVATDIAEVMPPGEVQDARVIQGRCQ